MKHLHFPSPLNIPGEFTAHVQQRKHISSEGGDKKYCDAIHPTTLSLTSLTYLSSLLLLSLSLSHLIYFLSISIVSTVSNYKLCYGCERYVTISSE